MTSKLSAFCAALFAAGCIAMPNPALSQTPYSHTAAGRPMRLEDAVSIERRAFDLFFSGAGIAFGGGEEYWAASPGFAWGLLPRTQVDLMVPLTGATSDGRLNAAVDVSVLHALNVESASRPALGIRAAVLVPLANADHVRARPSLKAMVTRTYGWGRLHLNHQYTFGESLTALVPPRVMTRWNTGVAMDRAFPLTGLLVGAEAYASRSIHRGASVRWNAGLGARYQVTTYTTLEAGVTTQLIDDPTWGFTVGVSRRTGVGSILPGLGRWDGRD
jgi:hypothetical protein